MPEVNFPIGRPVFLVRPSGVPMEEQVEIGAMLKPSPSTLLVSCASPPDQGLVAEIAECANALFVQQVVVICLAKAPEWFATLKRFADHGVRFRVIPMLPTPHLLACGPLALADTEGRLLNTIFFLHRLTIKAAWRATLDGEEHAFETFMNELHERSTDIFPSMTLEEALAFAASRDAA